MTVPSFARLWPPIEWRAVLATSGRPAVRASLNALRTRSTTSAFGSFVIEMCEATGVGDNSLASFRTTLPAGATVSPGG